MNNDELQKHIIEMDNELQKRIIEIDNRFATLQEYDLSEIQTKLIDLKNEIEEIKTFDLQQQSLFNNKVNQAYINQEVQNINIMQNIDNLQENYTNVIEDIKNLKNDHTTLFNDSTNIENRLTNMDKQIEELSNDQKLMFHALINMQQTFDIFNEMLTKERIMNTAIITVLTIELLSKGIINNVNYINNLKNVANQILEAYKAAGYNIDFSQEFKALTSELDDGTMAIHMPQIICSMQAAANKEETEGDKNIINFKDILKKKNTIISKGIDSNKKSKLYTDFQNKLNEVLSKKNNKNNNKDDKDK